MPRDGAGSHSSVKVSPSNDMSSAASTLKTSEVAESRTRLIADRELPTSVNAKSTSVAMYQGAS